MQNFLVWAYLRFIKKLNSPSKIIPFACQRYKSRAFLIQPDKNITVSYGELDKRVKNLIHFFSKKLLGPGDVVAFISANSFEYFEVRAAAHMSSLVFFGIPAHLEHNDITYFLRKTHCRLVFYRKNSNLDVAAVKSQTAVEECVDLDSEAYAGIFLKDIPYRKIPPKANELATLNVSSATTLRTPKIVELSEKSWVNSLYNYVLNSDTSPQKEIRFLCVPPFVTAGSTTFLPVLLAGITIVVMEGEFDAQKLESFISQCKITRLYITPSWLAQLLSWCKENNETLATLNNIIVGTERIPVSLFKEAIAFFGPKITVGYGMVEVLPPVTMLSAKDYYRKGALLAERLASVGKTLRGVEIKIFDEEGDELPQGITGRIAVKSATVSKGYLDNKDETKVHFIDGWFLSDDYGYFDKEGYLYVLGRKSELLGKNQNGRMIFAKELEEVIYSLGFVRQCCVLMHEQKAVAFVSLKTDMEKAVAEAKIGEYCDKNADVSFSPVRVIVKDNLPITPLGKLDRKLLQMELGG